MLARVYWRRRRLCGGGRGFFFVFFTVLHARTFGWMYALRTASFPGRVCFGSSRWCCDCVFSLFAEEVLGVLYPS
ncbi:hypothetical protein DFH08DRAFT_906325 [Mycena albidolilacea]|uniref:Uncharacterized protein n=1 Tax=Mycena albidolilacea TaxID=1033008 RepID=A0AAD6YYY5_9AGAR|nr:hypothetical protein DFH08DRAFT_906325 [Mycena albidolilacea]